MCMLINNTKKNVILAVIFLIILSFSSGCGKKESGAAPENSAAASVESPSEETEEELKEDTAAEEPSEVVSPEEPEPEPEERSLTKEELEKVEKDLGEMKYNGFIVAEFVSPKDIFWDEVFYNGADTDISKYDQDQIEKDFLKETGDEEIYASLTFVGKKEAEDFVKKTTGMTFGEMAHPLNWLYLQDQDVYVFEHGDTNYVQAKVISGTRKGDELSIDYMLGYFDENEEIPEGPVYRLVMNEGPDGYVFVSNLWNPPGGREAAVQEIYDGIIQKYARAVSEGWDMGKLTESNLSYLPGLFRNTRGEDFDPMEKMGYYFRDLDNDGTDELFIGADSDGEYPETVFEVYGVRDGDWIRIVSAGERDRYYLSEDNTFYNEGSSSASNYVLIHYGIEGSYKFLKPIDGIIYDMDFSDPDKEPWYYSKNDFWDTENAEHISEKMYDDYEKKAEDSYVWIDYTPFSSVEIREDDTSSEADTPSKADTSADSTEGAYTDDQICELALDHYEKETGYRPSLAAIDSSNGDMVTIQLYDNMGDHNSTSAWYEINRKTGKGTDSIFGTEIALW